MSDRPENATEEAIRLARESLAMQAGEADRAKQYAADRAAEAAEDRATLRARTRDHFASVALNGMLAGAFTDMDSLRLGDTGDQFAIWAYDAAEAMLRERDRRIAADLKTSTHEGESAP